MGKLLGSEMTIYLSKDDVISLPTQERGYLDKCTYLTSELMAVLGDRIGETGEWDVDGVECRVLIPNAGGWKQGRIKISLEFVPDPADPSPLEDLRQQVTQMS